MQEGSSPRNDEDGTLVSVTVPVGDPPEAELTVTMQTSAESIVTSDVGQLTEVAEE